MKKLPTYFISHGSPDLLLRQAPASKFMKELPLADLKPKAILMISAHFESEFALVTGASKPKTIHDFYGFDERLYQIQYPVLGDPKLAREICEILQNKNIKCAIDENRGLDHGAWMPLVLAFPNCEIPVLQLSIQPQEDAKYHYKIGEALAELREEGILIIGSGNITHNIRAALHRSQENGFFYAKQFDDWIDGALLKRSDEELMNWQKAPMAKWNHPSNDHILPLFVVLGASKSQKPTRIHHSFDLKVLSMASYCFGERV